MRCVGKRGKTSKGDIWWWNEEVKEAVPRKNGEVKEAVSRKKEAHKAMCENSTEENKRRYKSMKNKAKKAVSKVMR